VGKGGNLMSKRWLDWLCAVLIVVVIAVLIYGVIH
jgi:hypothetical protein